MQQRLPSTDGGWGPKDYLARHCLIKEQDGNVFMLIRFAVVSFSDGFVFLLATMGMLQKKQNETVWVLKGR